MLNLTIKINEGCFETESLRPKFVFPRSIWTLWWISLSLDLYSEADFSIAEGNGPYPHPLVAPHAEANAILARPNDLRDELNSGVFDLRVLPVVAVFSLTASLLCRVSSVGRKKKNRSKQLSMILKFYFTRKCGLRERSCVYRELAVIRSRSINFS